VPCTCIYYGAASSYANHADYEGFGSVHSLDTSNNIGEPAVVSCQACRYGGKNASLALIMRPEFMSFGALRLKGCDCVTFDSLESVERDPFPLLQLDPPEIRDPNDPDRVEIRGCQFLETMIRER
jgi:hypothetical protein